MATAAAQERISDMYVRGSAKQHTRRREFLPRLVPYISALLTLWAPLHETIAAAITVELRSAHHARSRRRISLTRRVSSLIERSTLFFVVSVSCLAGELFTKAEALSGDS
jgi:hypothetical protein